MLARTSDDHGATWSEPIDLTSASRDMADPKWRISVVGPGGMIQDRHGRLLAAFWKFEPFGNFALFSDDHGKTWQRSAPVPGPGDENQLVELADGRLLMDIRQETGPHRTVLDQRGRRQDLVRSQARIAGLARRLRHRAVYLEVGRR